MPSLQPKFSLSDIKNVAIQQSMLESSVYRYTAAVSGGPSKPEAAKPEAKKGEAQAPKQKFSLGDIKDKAARDALVAAGQKDMAKAGYASASAVIASSSAKVVLAAAAPAFSLAAISDLNAQIATAEAGIRDMWKTGPRYSPVFVSLPGAAPATVPTKMAAPAKPVTPAPAPKAASPAKKAAAPAPAKKDEDEDFDLFASDDEEEDAEKAALVAQRLKEYNEKKAAKPKPVAKSMVILDVKPWDDETDMKAMETEVRGITMEGLVWGTSKLVAIGYGIKKLQITAVVEDDKVGVDDLSDQITGFEDYVQSVDVAAFNKL